MAPAASPVRIRPRAPPAASPARPRATRCLSCPGSGPAPPPVPAAPAPVRRRCADSSAGPTTPRLNLSWESIISSL
ncbi:hypothetical protein U9M48_043402 [Paspalum notatum var. saurae]|uniref:Uncharacterized protein n=1 Tax=Paspalum notatum var. saurae TaxID=547442 RepID=A0AAQ3XH27_PASNO